MRPIAFALLALLSLDAFAQASLVSDGKVPVFREAEIDRLFKRSKFGKLLRTGDTEHPGCMQAMGAMFTALAEIGPLLHKKDANFTLDPVLAQALGAQTVTPRFPGPAYLTAMVRRVLIDGRLPEEWLQTAKALNAGYRIIDLAKLQYMADGIRHIDSIYVTPQAIRDRWEVEVLSSTSAADTTADLAFRDTYLDREVAWAGMKLLDLGNSSKRKSGESSDDPATIAHFEYEPYEKPETELHIYGTPKKEYQIRVTAKLADKQYVDLYRLPKGRRLLVRGRLWEMNKTATQFELRDALVFEDRDWSKGALLADPNQVAQCPQAVNDLTGVAPAQPGGFGRGR